MVKSSVAPRFKNVEVMQSKDFPTWFSPQLEVPDEWGGGWLGLAAIGQLAKMTPERNPSGRNDYDDPRADIKGLVKSIELVGMTQFPIVNRKEIIDGVRRVTSATKMSEDGKAPSGVIPVLFRPHANSTSFGETQAQCKKHYPFQKVETWLKDPSAVTWREKRWCQQAVDDVGRALVKKVTLAGQNVLSMLQYARRAYDYCQPETPRREFLQKAVRVQFLHGCQEELKLWLKWQKSPVVLARLINEESSLRCRRGKEVE